MTMDDDDNQDVRTRLKCGRAVLNLFRISHLQIFDLSFCPVPRFVYWKPLWLVSPHQCSGKSYFD